MSPGRVSQDDEIDQELAAGGIGQRFAEGARLEGFAIEKIGNDFVIGIHHGVLVLRAGLMRSCRSAVMGAASTARSSKRAR